MTTTTLWAHLPNAVHIDRVIASAKANQDQWQKSWAMAEWRAGSWYTLRKAVWDMTYSQGRAEVWLALHTAVKGGSVGVDVRHIISFNCIR